MLRRHWLTVAATIALGTGLGLAVPRLAAVAHNSPPSSPPAAMVRIHDGLLLAHGAAADIPVTVTCPTSASSSFDTLTVQVIQRSGNGIANGLGALNTVPCDGTHHTVVVTVTDSSTRPFKHGDAFGIANLELCSLTGPQPCTTATSKREIDLSSQGQNQNQQGQNQQGQNQNQQ